MIHCSWNCKHSIHGTLHLEDLQWYSVDSTWWLHALCWIKAGSCDLVKSNTTNEEEEEEHERDTVSINILTRCIHEQLKMAHWFFAFNCFNCLWQVRQLSWNHYAFMFDHSCTCQRRRKINSLLEMLTNWVTAVNFNESFIIWILKFNEHHGQRAIEILKQCHLTGMCALFK